MTVPNVIRRSSTWSWSFELPPWVTSADYLIGLAIAALAPAVFWPLLIKLTCYLMGVSVSLIALIAVGVGIFCLLATVYTLIARNR